MKQIPLYYRNDLEDDIKSTDLNIVLAGLKNI